jgi:hypothetical protein
MKIRKVALFGAIVCLAAIVCGVVLAYVRPATLDGLNLLAWFAAAMGAIIWAAYARPNGKRSK